jgi:hypothetical protein
MYLLGRRDLKRSELLLELRNIVLKVQKSLSNAQFNFVSRSSTSGLGDFVRSHVGTIG